MWYIELWDNGKRVTTRIPGGVKDTGPKQAIHEPS
jgi:hypothetical protein